MHAHRETEAGREERSGSMTVNASSRGAKVITAATAMATAKPSLGRRMVEQRARRAQAQEAGGPSDPTLKNPGRSPRARVRRRPADIRHYY